MDKYAGAKNLISELKLVHPKKSKQLKKENKSKIKTSTILNIYYYLTLLAHP
jgi:hypothetical protein